MSDINRVKEAPADIELAGRSATDTSSPYSTTLPDQPSSDFQSKHKLSSSRSSVTHRRKSALGIDVNPTQHILSAMDISTEDIGRHTENRFTSTDVLSAPKGSTDSAGIHHKSKTGFVEEHADEFDVDYSIAHEWRKKHRAEAHDSSHSTGTGTFDAHGHEVGEAEAKLMASFEGLDYDKPISDIRIGAQLRGKPKFKTFADRFLSPRWILTFCIGVSVGLVGFFIDTITKYTGPLRLKVADHFIGKGQLGLGYIATLAVALSFAVVSTLLVNYIEPVAAGSGIPEVKGYLNGSNYVRFLTLKTACVKVCGIICSISSGFVIGKEGPLIHIGAALGANFATLPGLWKLSWLKGALWPLRFRNDRDKRDFVSSGAAAGVAAAFGAPTGGICFALEEASTFWQLSLTWRTYFCTALSTSVLFLLQCWWEGDNNYYPRIKYGSPGGKHPFLQLWQLPWIGILALMGGLVGAAFCECNKHLSEWRKHFVLGRKPRQIIQVAIICIINISCLYWMPYIFHSCSVIVPNYECSGYQNKYYCGGTTPLPPALIASNPYCDYTCKEFNKYKLYQCSPTNENGQSMYNTMATLSMQTWDDVIYALFHDQSQMNKSTLIVFFILMFVLANITYGIAVPSGLFVPCILMGGTFGRLQGEIMNDIYPTGGVQPGIWAMLGAAAMLSGVTRITITITVILFETTGEWSLILPTMAIVIMAKSIADQFNISLYDMHVELKCIPFVEPDPPRHIEGLFSGDVMSRGAVCCSMIPRVHDVIQMLQGCRHNGFPCVSDTGKIRGLILRNQIITILKYYLPDNYITREQLEAHVPDPDEDWKHLLPEEAFAVSLQSKNLRVSDIEHLMKSVPLTAVVDLRPYMNRGPIVVTEITPILRAYGIVRGMGTRHIPVVNDQMEPVGMITRKELMSDFQNDLT